MTFTLIYSKSFDHPKNIPMIYPSNITISVYVCEEKSKMKIIIAISSKISSKG